MPRVWGFNGTNSGCVSPKFVGEVKFTEGDSKGEMRHPVFLRRFAESTNKEANFLSSVMSRDELDRRAGGKELGELPNQKSKRRETLRPSSARTTPTAPNVNTIMVAMYVALGHRNAR